VSLRYYHYVSESKVDQLFEQVPSKRLGKIAKKLTIDLKLLKAEFGTSGSDAQQSLYAKVRVVERFLDDEDAVVGVDDIDLDGGPLFFAGKMRLRWGRLDATPERSGVVYFTGCTSKTLLGMGGSDRHLVGAAEGGHSLRLGSATPDLIEAMRGHNELEPGFRRGHIAYDELPLLMFHAARLTGAASMLTFLAIPLEVAPIPAIPEAQQVLKRDDPEMQRLFKGDSRALLGTPVYVAMES
jgi:uncharacterized protein DUF7019